jgi:hypothetical protein
MSIMAPMPGLIRDPVGVFAGVREAESVPASVHLEPAERRCPFKSFGERGFSGSSNVDGPPGMVLAIARRGNRPKDSFDRLPCREPAPYDLSLALDAPESGKRDERDPGGRSGVPHPDPGRRSAGRKADLAPGGKGVDQDQHGCLCLDGQPAPFSVVCRNSEPLGHGESASMPLPFALSPSCEGRSGCGRAMRSQTIIRRARRASARHRSPPGSPCRRR